MIGLFHLRTTTAPRLRTTPNPGIRNISASIIASPTRNSITISPPAVLLTILASEEQNKRCKPHCARSSESRCDHLYQKPHKAQYQKLMMLTVWLFKKPANFSIGSGISLDLSCTFKACLLQQIVPVSHLVICKSYAQGLFICQSQYLPKS